MRNAPVNSAWLYRLWVFQRGSLVPSDQGEDESVECLLRRRVERPNKREFAMKRYCHKLRNHTAILFKVVKKVSREGCSSTLSKSSGSAFPFRGGGRAAQIARMNPGLGHSLPLGPRGFIPMGFREDCSLRVNMSLLLPELILMWFLH